MTVWRNPSAIRNALSGTQFSSSTPNSSPPEARQRIALAQSALQHRADLAHQLITGGVAAGIVDHLELVEIEIHHRMVTPELRGTLQSQA